MVLDPLSDNMEFFVENHGPTCVKANIVNLRFEGFYLTTRFTEAADFTVCQGDTSGAKGYIFKADYRP